MKQPSIAALAVALLASGCGQHVTVVPPDTVSERMRFLRDGDTTQQEMLDRFGTPAHSFERDRTIVYVVHEDYHGSLSVGVGTADDRLYHLVAVFTLNGVLERHSLVRLR